MVNLNVVRSCNTSLVNSQPLVAVFVGGTAGIGEFSIRSLAATHAENGKGLRAYIVGRNAESAQSIITDCQKVCPKGQFRFIQANDLSLLKDVDLVCTKLIQAEEDEVKVTGGTARVDYLAMTQAIFKPFEARKGKNIVLFSKANSHLFLIPYTFMPTF
jgi:NAD(P)-dependent dehydrogenase (short-subunit alcohol dehydrogenase family)